MEKSRHSRFIVTTMAVLFGLLCWYNANSDDSLAWAAPGDSQSQGAMGGEGWYKTKWGMSPEEVSAALGDTIVPVPQQDRRKYNTEYQYTISDFKIGNFSFSVYLAFKSGKGLNDVMVTTKKGEGDHYACFLELEDALKKKYGSPSSSAEDENDKQLSFKLRYREWLTQASIIKLNNITFFDSEPLTYDRTNVLYSARSAGDDRL